MRLVVFALLFAGVSALEQPRPQRPSVTDAQAALVAALTRHDQSAFEQLVAPDAVFFLPSLHQGRQQISQTWLPFLLAGSGLTITLVPATAVVAESQDLAYTTGTFAFSGSTDKEVGPPTGEYFAAWRFKDGKWMVQAFTGAARAAKTAAPPAGGVGACTFGMTRDQVRHVDACEPYLDVPSTGGLECPNFVFESRKMNISFLCTGQALRRVQLWLYQGGAESDAKQAIDRAIEYLKRTTGGVHSYELPQGAEVTSEEILKSLNARLQPGAVVQLQLTAPPTSAPEVWTGRIGRYQDGFMAFLLADPRQGR